MSEEQQRPKRVDDVEISGPLGWKIRFPARSLSAVVVVVACVGVLAYMVRDHDLRSQESAKEMITETKATREGMRELSYLMTLDDNEIKQIRLGMPESLRTRLLDSERGR